MKLALFMKTCVLFVFTLITTFIQANTFYVDASTTSSTQNGSLANPWKTLTQVNSNMGSFNAGDFILLKRGGTFTGTLTVSRSGSAGSPITFGAYGTGNKPKLTGTGNTVNYLIYLNNRSYVTFRDWEITDPSIDNTNRSIDSKIERAFTFDGNSNNCKIISCDIELVGVAGYFVGGTNTMDSCDVGNLRMVVDTDDGNQPGNDDDYGANPLVIASGNNIITHNYFHDCWATSFDYDYDGGAIEFYGDGTNNNFIGYNTIYDCIGLSEVTGNSSNNTYTYNKIINNGSLLYFQSGSTYSGYKFYNNVIIENVATRVPESRLIGGSFSSGAVVLKNNVFHLSNGVDVAGSSGITHEDNIYKLSNNSVTGYTVGATELNTSVAIFTNTTPANPVSWNFAPVTGSPAIDFGQNVGQTKDFAGNPVPAIPNSGILESSSTPPSTLAAASTAGTISCNGGSTNVTVTGSGGTPPYTGTGTFNVSAGTYTYNVTDATGTVKTTTITVSQPAAIAITISAGSITVYGGTTNVTINASGGTGSYTYSLNGGSYQPSNTFNSVPAGNHSVNVKDANACISLKNFTLTQPAANPLITSSTAGSITCNGGTTTVTVTASGGVSPYTGTGSFTVGAGTHNYTVTDASGATQSTTIVITQPAAIVVSISAGTIITFGGSTTITVASSGGSGTHTYKLNNGSYQSSGVFNNVLAGTHTIRVKDANGCIETRTITITEPAANPLIASSATGIISCNGGTGTITVTATGGTAPYTGTGTFTVGAGNYNYTVTDASGAAATTSASITAPSAINVAVTTGTITVYGGSTDVTVNATGGTGAYIYKLNAGTYQPGNTFSNVSAGTHSVTVKDANGCTSVKSFTLTQPALNTLIVSATATPVNCYDEISTITVSASGGTAPYTGAGMFTGYAGTYNYTVTDASGATATTTITITQPDIITILVSAGTISTSGGTTTVSVNATGGTGSYSYNLDAVGYQSGNSFTNVGAGAHSVTVKDARGCTITKNFTITSTVTSNFQIALVSKTNAVCKGSATGTIEVTATGGIAPYTYQLNNGSYGSATIFRFLRTGLYRVNAKDANGNISSLIVYILDGRKRCTGNVSGRIGMNLNTFPNPSTDKFTLTVDSESEENVTVEVFNMKGTKIYSETGSVDEIYSFGERFISGTYFIRVSQGKEIKTMELIKAK